MIKIKIEIIVNADIQKVWRLWTDAESIKQWAFASDDWECLYAENDVRAGGRFLTRMSAKDKSEGFDFTGTYTEVKEQAKIAYLMDKMDGESQQRECEVLFTDRGDGTTKIEEEFSSEEINSEELQRAGWTAILGNFKKLAENN